MKRIVTNRVAKGLLASVLVILVALGGILAYRAFRTPAATAAAPVAVSTPDYWPTAGWRVGTPESQGFDSAKLAASLATLPENHLGLHSLQVVRHGYLIFDSYFYPYDGSTYHDFASSTKSIMSTLIGIAVDQGKISLDATVLSYFPGRTIQNRSERKERVTVRNLLTMSSGMKWDAHDDEVYLTQLRASPDWVQWALDQPVDTEPGARYVYNSANMHLLSAILTQATGQTALEFARANLFAPLGITDVDWRRDPQGFTRGWGDLSLHPTDAAKIGFLFLQQGGWERKQVVSKEWVAVATSFKIRRNGGDNYGYGWYVTPPEDKTPSYSAQGRKSQRIIVVPKLETVIVITAADDGAWDNIESALAGSIGNLEAPLPDNPSGMTELTRLLTQFTQAPATQPVALPPVATQVSGRTFGFAPNQAQLESIRLSFDSPAEIGLQLKVGGESAPRVGKVGLDGIYRSNQGGIPWIARATWGDAQALVIEMSEGPGLNNYTFRLTLAADRIGFELVGMATLEGRAQ